MMFNVCGRRRETRIRDRMGFRHPLNAIGYYLPELDLFMTPNADVMNMNR